MNRRHLLAGLVAAGALRTVPSAAEDEVPQWFPLLGDDGKPIPNMRLPNGLVIELTELPGTLWVGAETTSVVLIELFDYNCPYCRKAAQTIQGMLDAMPDLRVGFVNNPILSIASAGAARVELAVMRSGGPEPVYKLHKALIARRGLVDAGTALDAAEALGFERDALAAMAEGSPIREAFSVQVRLAAQLGLAATPSFVIGGMGVLGYPGPDALQAMVDSVRRCDRIAC